MSQSGKKSKRKTYVQDDVATAEREIDAGMIFVSLSRIGDPMVAYLLGMLIDRIAELMADRDLNAAPIEARHPS